MSANNNFNDPMDRNPANWRGPFYYNPKDSRIRVPKQDTMRGWTFNFANPYSYLFIISIMVIIALTMYLGL